MKKILIIEDNDSIRENTAEILEMSGFQLFTAENGKRGVEVALREHPDLILCDVMMPVLDGFGVLHMLRKNSSTKNTPFIFLTAKSERDDFRKGMEMGADDYITKPFTEAELLKAVDSRMQKVQLIREKLESGHNAPTASSDHRSGKELLRELVSGRNVNRYKKKQVIFAEGNRPTCLFYVIKGKVRVYKSNDFGKELVVGLYREGECFGFVDLLENVNYQETAAAMEETELAIVPRQDFEELVVSSPEVNRQFIKLLAKNITDKENKLVALAYNSLRKKVADALVTLYEKYNNDESAAFTINITRDNLATIAGTAIESLIRTLGDFKEEKLIEIKDGVITILNKRKLQDLVN